ncbi:MAG: hypothetical protein J6B24_08840 [Clostridia bacterium]|nr:hypothetical protein [Clostridia bacterium]
MKTTTLRRLLSVVLCLALVMGAVAMTACANKGKTLLELNGHTISSNQYQLLLSRVRGSLAYAGYSVDSPTFWEMVIDSEGNTYDEYFRNAALADAKRYLAAAVIFDEEGLVLPQSYKEAIDEDIDEYIRDAGSKSALNSQLSAYGVNVDMLRDLYLLEAKYDYVQTYLYGAEGEKIAANVRHDYLTEHAVCFKQVLIRAFDYVYETDLNGDEIYYKVGENNAKVNNIAYDVVNGNTRLDEYDKTIEDKNGDAVYYLPNGSIAYDKENGVRAVVYDEKGVAKTKKYTAEELAEHKAAAEEMMASVAKGDYAAFEALMEEYQVSGDDAFVTDGTYCFLYTTGDNDYDYLNDIADVLAESEEGTIRMVSSEYGYNVVMKYPIPQDAVTNSAYEDWFGDLTERVMAKLFHAKCEPYMEKVAVSNEEFANLPSMKEVGTNYNY